MPNRFGIIHIRLQTAKEAVWDGWDKFYAEDVMYLQELLERSRQRVGRLRTEVETLKEAQNTSSVQDPS